jgi:hypothetical protein
MKGRRSAGARRVVGILAALGLPLAWAGTAADANAADLHPATVAAFDRYVRLTEARLDREMGGSAPFLWVDGLPESQRRDTYARLRRGETVVSRLETRDDGRPIDVPDGMCHHWVGTMFAAGARLDQVVRLMQNYDSYQDVYQPAVRRSRTLSHSGDRFTTYLQLYMKKVISVVLNTEYDVRYIPIAPGRMQVWSHTTRIAEVQDPDTPDEREKPVGSDNGFLWRFGNYCALDARDGGTYVQCESVSLTRDIPTGLGWLIGPFVTGIPRESLEFTLGAMRTAVTSAR